MKKIFGILCVVFCIYQVQAQSTIDDLTISLQTAQDTAKVKILLKLTVEYSKSDLKQAGVFADWAYQYADSIGDEKGISRAIVQKGFIASKSDLNKAIELYQQALSRAEKMEDHDLISSIFNRLAAVYATQGNLADALDSRKKAIEHFRKKGDREALALALGSISTLYARMRKDNEALESIDEATALARQLNSKGLLASLAMNRGFLYIQKVELSKAKESFIEAAKLHHETGSAENEARALTNVGGVFSDMGDLRSAAPYYLRALDIQKKIGVKNTDVTYFNIGILYSKLNENALATAYADTVVQIARNMGIKSAVARGLGLKASIYNKAGDYPNALDAYLSALNEADSAFSIGVMVDIAGLYRKNKQDSLALHYTRRALSTARQLEKINLIALAYSSFGAHYESINYDSSLHYVQKALAIYEKTGMRDMKGNQMIRMGKVLGWKKEYKAAVEKLKEAVEIGETGSKSVLISGLQELGNVYVALKDWNNALRYSQRAFDIASKSNQSEVIKNTSEALATAYEGVGNYKKAFEYQKKLMALNDSIFNREKMIEIGRVESKFTLEQKENENILLRKDQQIKEATIASQQSQLILSTTVGILLLILAALFYQNVRSKKKTNKLLEETNKRISEKNEELIATLEKLKTTQTQLIHSEKMASLGMLTAGIAHEINNPVNFISGGVQALEANIQHLIREETLIGNGGREQIVTEIGDLISSIKNGVERTTTIVTGLQSFTREKQVNESIDINDCIDSTLTILKSRLANTKVLKHYKEVPLLSANSGQLNQVLLNILANAIHAIETKGQTGEIIITTSNEENFNVISIKDNGVGIPKEIQSRIFDPFFTTKDVGQGTGLGLSISYDIIKSHHGSITFNSQPGDGTEFLIRLPLL